MIAETGGSPATAKPAPALSQPTAGIAHGLTVTLPTRSLEKIARELHTMNLLTWTDHLDARGGFGGGMSEFANTLAAHFALDHQQ